MFEVNPAEFWPVLTLSHSVFYDCRGEFTEDELNRIEACETEFNAIQQVIHERVGRTGEADSFHLLDRNADHDS